jgi:glyoxylase-like metal-dependent hydrolase (beta-lactamase superfamily II)
MIHYIDPIIPIDSNIYLLTGHYNVIIDAGTGLCSRMVIDRIKETIGPDGVVEKVLLTHCHFDHIGGVPALVEEYGCEVFIGHGDAPALRDGDASYTLSTDFDIDVPPIPVTDLY